jgi:hypothetical protein
MSPQVHNVTEIFLRGANILLACSKSLQESLGGFPSMSRHKFGHSSAFPYINIYILIYIFIYIYIHIYIYEGVCVCVYINRHTPPDFKTHQRLFF